MSVFIYSCLSYPAYKAQIFYTPLNCRVWPVWLPRIFLHYLINGEFRKKNP